MSTGTPPAIPEALQVYNSYAEDPKWQTKFTIIWASLVGTAIVASLPHLVRSIRNGREFVGLFGITEDLNGKNYAPIDSDVEPMPSSKGGVSRLASGSLSMVTSVVNWSLPGIELNAGQIFVVIVYLILVLICMILNAPLISNPNRAGFIALAQFPVVFLFSTKNSLLSLLLGPGNGYEKLNYIHRWSGRCMFLGSVVHGALWIRNHLEWSLPILGQQKETSGVAALGLLCVIVLSSLKPVRRFCYQAFWVIHMLSFVAFFITICYHTIYASPWIFPPLAFYGLDILMRMFRVRVKDATLVAVNKQMTIIQVNDCDAGWLAGQHVRLRVFFSGRIFESHPLTIFSAPSATSCITTTNHALMLGARVTGDWTRALNEYAQSEHERLLLASGEKYEETNNIPTTVPVQVMIDGPYGGCSIDLGRYESVLLFAGGSGATFTIGLLDDIVGRCVKLGRRNGEKTRRVEFAWCIRSFGSIEWFTPYLMDIANTAASSSSSLDLHISIYVTCLCNPEAIPPIPNSDVTIVRPSVHAILEELLTPPSIPSSSTRTSTSESQSESGTDSGSDSEKGEKSGSGSAKLKWVGLGGGVGVCASGPESLTREAANAVARLGMLRGVELGGVALHTELFSV